MQILQHREAEDMSCWIITRYTGWMEPSSRECKTACQNRAREKGRERQIEIGKHTQKYRIGFDAQVYITAGRRILRRNSAGSVRRVFSRNALEAQAPGRKGRLAESLRAATPIRLCSAAAIAVAQRVFIRACRTVTPDDQRFARLTRTAESALGSQNQLCFAKLIPNRGLIVSRLNTCPKSFKTMQPSDGWMDVREWFHTILNQEGLIFRAAYVQLPELFGREWSGRLNCRCEDVRWFSGAVKVV